MCNPFPNHFLNFFFLGCGGLEKRVRLKKGLGSNSDILCEIRSDCKSDWLAKGRGFRDIGLSSCHTWSAYNHNVNVATLDHYWSLISLVKHRNQILSRDNPCLPLSDLLVWGWQEALLQLPWIDLAALAQLTWRPWPGRLCLWVAWVAAACRSEHWWNMGGTLSLDSLDVTGCH